MNLLTPVLALLIAASLPQPSRADTPLSPGEHTALLNGARLWYKIAGKQQPGVAPVLYLAGGPGYNSYSFEKTIGPQLEAHLPMLYFDERGTGRSERPQSGDYALPTLVEDVEALRKYLGVPQLNVMGQSFGGTLALEYASRYPEHVQHLLLVDAAADFPEAIAFWQRELGQREPAVWRQAMATPEGAALRRAEQGDSPCALTKARFAVILHAYATPISAEFHHWQQFHDRQFQRQQDALDAASGLGNTGEMSRALFSPGNPLLCYRFTAYHRLRMPVLAIEGRYDGAVDPEQMRRLAAKLPRAHYDEFEQSAHFPYAEEPQKFAADVTNFLTTAH